MIQFIHVEKTYANGTTALQNINLKIEQGEFVAVIGLSGAGKSTFIRCINRMHDISKGQIIVDDIDVSKLKGRQIRRFRRRIGMIFQSFNLVTRTTVLKNVLVSFVPDLPAWRKFTGIFTKAHKVKALEALDKVGILDKAYVRVDQLSGGQQQRVALARTLAQNPDIILADEPIASLDPVTARMHYLIMLPRESDADWYIRYRCLSLGTINRPIPTSLPSMRLACLSDFFKCAASSTEVNGRIIPRAYRSASVSVQPSK